MSGNESPEETDPADIEVEGEPTESEESLFLTYVAPFLGVLLIAAGLPLAVLGGYVVVQDALGLCGDPDLEVRALGADEQPSSTVGELEYEELSDAERRALREAIDSPLEEATIEGEMQNRDALLEGAVVGIDGDRYYVRIASLNSCLEAQPLLFPIGAVGILLGIVGVLTPPIYRKLAGFEERIQQ